MSESGLTMQEQLMAPLTFNKENLAKIGHDDDATGLALLIIFVNSAIQGFATITSGGGGIASFIIGDRIDELGGFGDFLVGFILQVLILLLFSAVLSFVLRGFGGGASTAQSLRMIGFASVWSVIGSIVALIPDLDIAIIFTLLFLGALTLGLSSFSGKGVVTSFIALIIAYILALILTFILLIFLVLAIIIAIFG